MRHVISALVTNEPGVLANVAGMFAARGFNIDSLVVGRTEDDELSRMTVVVEGDQNVIRQVQEQLAKLVPVARVRNLTQSAYVERDLALVKIDAPPEKRHEITELVNMFRGNVVDVGPESMSVEISGREEKVEAFVDLVGPYGIQEMARTGVIAIARGTQSDRLRKRYGRVEPDDQSKRVRSLDNASGESLPPS
ncbi:MAG: acetolactate synthase small subunit [Planctomycetota bacterium]